MTAGEESAQRSPGRRSWTIHAGAARWRVGVRGTATCLVAAGLCAVLLILALTLGKFSLSIGEVVAVLTGQDDGFARTVVLEWRAPRAFAAITFGAALGISGAIFQSLTRNALASPDILGISTGGYTGALIVIVLTGGGLLWTTTGALIGAFTAAAAVYLLAFRGGIQGYRLIIVGIAISAILSSFNTWLILVAELDVAISAAVWGSGDLSGTNGTQVAITTGVLLTLGVAVFALAPALHQLDLGDDAAAALGVPVERIRLLTIGIAVACTAVVTAIAGPIAFIALSAPQIARRAMRSPGMSLTGAAVFGALLLLASDVVAQHLIPTTLPVGIVTVVLGGTYLIWLLIEETRRRL